MILHSATPSAGFKSPGEFLLSVADSTAARRILDNRLHPLAAAGSDEGGTHADPAGGFLIPRGFVSQPLAVPGYDPIGQRCTPIKMDRSTCPVPARNDKDHSSSISGGLVVGRRIETAEADASRIQVAQITLEARELWGVTHATEELMADSPVAFTTLLQRSFADEYAAVKLRERLHGTGVGELVGVVTAGCTITVSKETGQAAASIVGENIIAMRARCWRYDGGACWLANPECYPALVKCYLDTDAGTLWLYAHSRAEGEPDRLAGAPIFYSEECSALGTLGDIVLGNWGEYLDATYVPARIESSIHVRFLEHERTFRFYERNDGCPWWHAALTPRNGTDTLSPFVVLEARE